MGVKFSKKLDDLETTSVNLTRKFEALQAQRRGGYEVAESEMMRDAPTIDATQTEQTTIKKGNGII